MKEDIIIVADYWNKYSPKFDEAHNTENVDLWRVQMKELIQGNRGTKVLDIGTGTGFLALISAELGYQSVGVDIADDMMNLGKLHAQERNVKVEFIHSAGEHLPFEDDSFDVVTNCRVLWTLLNPAESFQEWKRVIKMGGKLISFIRKFDPDKQMTDPIYSEELDRKLPLKNADNPLYIQYMEQAGFKNIRIIDMPVEMSYSDAAPWIAVYGEK